MKPYNYSRVAADSSFKEEQRKALMDRLDASADKVAEVYRELKSVAGRLERLNQYGIKGGPLADRLTKEVKALTETAGVLDDIKAELKDA